MNQFTASNGVRLYADAGRLELEGAGVILGAERVDALREFFRAEEDERLGRWRWPDDSDYLVYEDEDGDVTVINERKATVSSLVIQRDLSQRNPAHPVTQAARAYFDAHPEPKPWRDAREGELWALTANGFESVYALRVHRWERISDCAHLHGEQNSPSITAGRRIWPES